MHTISILFKSIMENSSKIGTSILFLKNCALVQLKVGKNKSHLLQLPKAYEWILNLFQLVIYCYPLQRYTESEAEQYVCRKM